MAIRGEMADAFARLDACGAEPELVALASGAWRRSRTTGRADAGEVAQAVTALLAAAEERARQAELDRVRAEGEQAKAEAEAHERRKRRRVQLALIGTVVGLVAAAGFGVALASLWQTAERGEGDGGSCPQ